MFGWITSLLSGGATGVLGSLVTNVADYFEEKRKNQHEIELRKLDIEEMQQEYEARKEIAAQQSQAQTTKTSYEHDARSYTSGMKIKSPWLKAGLVFVDMVRGLVRPALTVFLIVLVWMTFSKVQAVLESAGVDPLPVDRAGAIYASVVDMILYLAATSVTWWFGTSPRSKKD